MTQDNKTDDGMKSIRKETLKRKKELNEMRKEIYKLFNFR